MTYRRHPSLKLEELRKTLINDIVTGKICVIKQEAHHG